MKTTGSIFKDFFHADLDNMIYDGVEIYFDRLLLKVDGESLDDMDLINKIDENAEVIIMEGDVVPQRSRDKIDTVKNAFAKWSMLETHHTVMVNVPKTRMAQIIKLIAETDPDIHVFHMEEGKVPRSTTDHSFLVDPRPDLAEMTRKVVESMGGKTY